MFSAGVSLLIQKAMRYKVIGYKIVQTGWPCSLSAQVVEQAKTKEEANILYDIMLEDESMVGEVKVLDTASNRYVRNSMDENEQPL